MGKLSNIIRNRPAFLLLHGGSLVELEQHVHNFADADVCWVGTGLFTNHEKFITSKIGKNLDIVVDMASVPDGFRANYELNVRLPRLYDYLARPDANAWVTSHGIIRDCVNPWMPKLHQHDNKIMVIDDLFPKVQIGKWMDVPNSTTLAIAALLAGGASRIFIFGMDGYKGDVATGVKSYFHPETHEIERTVALGSNQDPGINRDTNNFEARFPVIRNRYYSLFGNNAPIYNVSPNSVYTILPKIGTHQVRGHLR